LLLKEQCLNTASCEHRNGLPHGEKPTLI
jgi:hypothetical protein